MTTLAPLTALEREQLRYIVERVHQFPEGHGAIWVTSVGWIAGIDPHEDGYQFKNMDRDHPRWPTYSPNFTRAQYDAMKAEMAAPAIDYRAHCEALAEALEHIREYWNRDQNETAMADALWHIIEIADEAITRWKEDSK